jgi:hypothetical protein
VQAGHVDTVVAIIKTKVLPVVVQRVAVDQIVPGVGGRVDDAPDVLERQDAKRLVPVDLAKTVVLVDSTTSRKSPPREVELEDAVGVGDLLLPASRRRRRDHGFEVRRLCRRSGPLHPSHVTKTGRAHFAIAPGLGRDPLDDVVRVGHVVREAAPVAFGLSAATAVNGDEDVTVVLVQRDVTRDQDHIVLVIGRHFDNCRQRLIFVPEGHVHVGGELHAIAHRNTHFQATLRRVALAYFDPTRKRRRVLRHASPAL